MIERGSVVLVIGTSGMVHPRDDAVIVEVNVEPMLITRYVHAEFS